MQFEDTRKRYLTFGQLAGVWYWYSWHRGVWNNGATVMVAGLPVPIENRTHVRQLPFPSWVVAHPPNSGGWW
jgi:hypothetical protein